MHTLMTALRNLGIALYVTWGEPGYAMVLAAMQVAVEVDGTHDLASHARGLRILLEIALHMFGSRLTTASTQELPVGDAQQCLATFKRLFRLENLELTTTVSVSFAHTLGGLITWDQSVLLKYQSSNTPALLASPSTSRGPVASGQPVGLPDGLSGGGLVAPLARNQYSSPRSLLLSGGVCMHQLGYVLGMELVPGGASTPCPMQGGGACAGRFHPLMSSYGDGPVRGEVQAEELIKTLARFYRPRQSTDPTTVELETAVRRAF